MYLLCPVCPNTCEIELSQERHFQNAIEEIESNLTSCLLFNVFLWGNALSSAPLLIVQMGGVLYGFFIG